MKTKLPLRVSILVASQLASAAKGCRFFGFHAIRRSRQRASRDARGGRSLVDYVAHLYNAMILYNLLEKTVNEWL